MRVLAPALTEEVAERHRDGGRARVLPVRAQHERTPVGAVRGQPDMPDDAGPGQVSEHGGRARRDLDAGRDLPARTEFARGGGSRAVRRRPTPARCAGRVLGADRPCQPRGQQRHPAPAESIHSHSFLTGRRLPDQSWWRPRPLPPPAPAVSVGAHRADLREQTHQARCTLGGISCSSRPRARRVPADSARPPPSRCHRASPRRRSPMPDGNRNYGGKVHALHQGRPREHGFD